MINSTQSPYFTLGAYFDTRLLKYFCFMIVLFIYALIICANLLLIVVICRNRSLHEPMYLFLCSLFVNELYGSTGLFPLLLVQILSDVHTVPAPLCFLQIFCVYSYVSVEFFNLAIISYDRYLAICYPLQYNTCMTFRNVAMLIAVTWLTSVLMVVGTLSLSSPLQLCGNTIANVYCNNYSIVKLSCSDTRANNIYGLFITAFTVFVPLVLILYTYIKILRVVQSRFDMNNVPTLLPIFLSLYFITCQPLLNPVMYGLKMSKILNISQPLLEKLEYQHSSSGTDRCAAGVEKSPFKCL
uniref:olfactory receptor 11A1-like n=1 Tax=Semicossyphus pulcher TaxID=241346 RepID=UPI0037E89A9D